MVTRADRQRHPGYARRQFHLRGDIHDRDRRSRSAQFASRRVDPFPRRLRDFFVREGYCGGIVSFAKRFLQAILKCGSEPSGR